MKRLALIFSLLSIFGGAVRADEILTVVLQDHKFTPAEIHIPANQKTPLKIKNLDATPEEFECPGLRVADKVIGPKGEVTVRLSPMAPGRYTFIGEYHEKTARGLAVVE